MVLKNYEKEITLGLWACLYATLIAPVVVGISYLFPFVFPKAIYFQALVEIAFILYVALLTIDRKYLPRRTIIMWGLIAYVGAIALSTIFAADKSLAFWSKAERMDGLFQYLHLIVYFIILTGVIRQEEQWLRILKFSMWSGVGIGFVSLVSRYFPDVLNFGIQGRISGTFGNPSFLATYYLILSFIALVFLLREKSKEGKFVAGTLFFFFVILLFLSGTRGAYIGFMVGLAALVVMLMTNDWKRWKRFGAILVLVFVVLAATLYFSKGFLVAHRSSNLMADFILDRVFNLVNFPPARLISWRIAWNAFRARPIFGWGQENYIFAFNTHFDPDIHTYDLSLFDRAHNKLLDLLSMNGIPGLISYLFLFGGLAYSMAWVMRKKVVNPVWPACFFGLTVGYLVQNLVLFEMPTSGMMLFFFAAFMSWMVSEVRAETAAGALKEHNGNKLKAAGAGSGGPLLPQWVIVPVAAVILLAFTIGIWMPLHAAQAVVSMASIMAAGNMSSQERLSHALALYQDTRDRQSTYLDREYDVLIARRVRETASGDIRSDKQFQALAEDLLKNLEQDFKKHPLDYDILMEIANIYFLLQSTNPTYAAKTYDTLEQARALAPKREDAYQQLAMWYLSRGDYANADKSLQSLLALNSKVGRFWWFRAVYQAAVNDPKGAAESLANAEQYSYDWKTVGNFVYLATTFERNKNGREAVHYYGVMAEQYATSSFDVTAQALDRVFGHAAQDPGLRADAIALKERILNLNPDQKKAIDVIVAKYLK